VAAFKKAAVARSDRPQTQGQRFSVWLSVKWALANIPRHRGSHTREAPDRSHKGTTWIDWRVAHERQDTLELNQRPPQMRTAETSHRLNPLRTVDKNATAALRGRRRGTRTPQPNFKKLRDQARDLKSHNTTTSSVDSKHMPQWTHEPARAPLSENTSTPNHTRTQTHTEFPCHTTHDTARPLPPSRDTRHRAARQH